MDIPAICFQQHNAGIEGYVARQVDATSTTAEKQGEDISIPKYHHPVTETTRLYNAVS